MDEYYSDYHYDDYQKASNEAFLPLSEAERYRLVEAAKSQTDDPLVTEAMKQAFMSRQRMPRPKALAAEAEGPFCDLRDREIKADEADKFYEQYCNEVGSKTIIQFREWSDEYRIMTRVTGTVGSPPPLQSGDRISKVLSDRAARKIADSCFYMSSIGKGFSTFVTGTFNPEARARIDSGETSVQKEVTRTMDALKKMYQRGWVVTDSGKKIPGHSEPFSYCWVVEVPLNDEGEPNPHVHMLLDWSVDYEDFQPWRKRIESIWGNGYFHLEKIKDPLCAGAYMAKAAGYMTKANGQDDQGVVKGNRYAISKSARAPEWYTVEEFELGVMGSLIREVHDSIMHKHSAIFFERKQLTKERERVKIQAVEQQKKQGGKYPYWAKQKLDRLGGQLASVREKISALSVRTTKYQLVIKGKEAFNRFMGWARAGGWLAGPRADSHWYKAMKEKIYERKRRRGAWLDRDLTEYMEEKDREWEDTLSDYENNLKYLD